MKNQMINTEQIMFDLAHTAVKQLTDEEQEWLGIFHSGEKIEYTLKKYPELYSNEKKAAMYGFLSEIQKMKEKFDRFYSEFLKRG